MSKKPRKHVVPLSREWELRGDPEIERAVRDVRELDDGEVIERLCCMATFAAENGSYYNAELVLEAARRWSAAKADAERARRMK